jgi:hypothetical protein
VVAGIDVADADELPVAEVIAVAVVATVIIGFFV